MGRRKASAWQDCCLKPKYCWTVNPADCSAAAAPEPAVTAPTRSSEVITGVIGAGGGPHTVRGTLPLCPSSIEAEVSTLVWRGQSSTAAAAAVVPTTTPPRPLPVVSLLTLAVSVPMPQKRRDGAEQNVGESTSNRWRRCRWCPTLACSDGTADPPPPPAHRWCQIAIVSVELLTAPASLTVAENIAGAGACASVLVSESALFRV